jgi:hypothetical protein
VQRVAEGFLPPITTPAPTAAKDQDNTFADINGSLSIEPPMKSKFNLTMSMQSEGIKRKMNVTTTHGKTINASHTSRMMLTEEDSIQSNLEQVVVPRSR